MNKNILLLLIASWCHVMGAQQLDTSFNWNGVVFPAAYANSNNSDVFYNICKQSTGQILVTSFQDGQYTRRYNSDGSQDMSFGWDVNNNGFSQSFNHVGAISVFVLPDDKYLIASGGFGGFQFTRFMADGNVDTTFGQGGTKTVMVEGSGNSLLRPILTQDNKLVFAGSRSLVNATWP